MPGIRSENPYLMTRWGPVPLYDSKPSDWDIKGLAETLAHEHRFVGNYGPYSVAQHCVAVAKVTEWLLNADPKWCHSYGWEAKRRIKLAALVHDGPEAVTGDIPSPVKMEIKADCDHWKMISKSLDRSLEGAIGVPEGTIDHPAIKEADLITYIAEVRMLVPKDRWHLYEHCENDCGYRREHEQPTWGDILPWSPMQAMAAFLDKYEEWQK